DDPPADREALRLAGHQRGDHRGRAGLHPVLAPPGVRLCEPDRVHPGRVHDACRLEHLLERLHRQLHDADSERWRHCQEASVTRCSSAASTCETCWLTIGCRTRWPMAPTGPAIFTSASQAIDVPPSASESVNDVVMSISAPTPWPFARMDANSGSRSSTFSK